MEEQNIPAGTLAQQGETLAGEGKTPLYFALDGKALGIIAVADQIKPDSAHAIARLHELGIQTALVTRRPPPHRSGGGQAGGHRPGARRCAAGG